MQPYEVNMILEYIGNADKTSWEQTRMQMYITAQVNSKKKLKPVDIMKFSWDDIKQDIDTSISNSDVERLTNKAKELEKYFSKK